MEVDEEVDSKKKLDERKKKLQKQLRDIEKLTDMEQRLVDEQKEELTAGAARISSKSGMISCLSTRTKRCSAKRTLRNAMGSSANSVQVE